MKLLRTLITVACLVAVSSPCFALREIAPVTKAEAKAMGIEVRAMSGDDAVWFELEFKPAGKLKEFTHAAGRGRPAISRLPHPNPPLSLAR